MEVIVLELLPVPTSATIKSGERVVDKRHASLLNAFDVATQSLSMVGDELGGARISMESEDALDPVDGSFPGFWITPTAAIRTMIPTSSASRRADAPFIF